MNLRYMHRAVEIALEAESKGNLPIGAVIVLADTIIAEATSSILVPYFHPGRHAETEALRLVDPQWWPRRREMTCYTTLEPCLMCTGALVLHGVGRVIYGAYDTFGGARGVLSHLPPYYADGQGIPEWIGPVLPEVCDELYARTRDRFLQIDHQEG